MNQYPSPQQPPPSPSWRKHEKHSQKNLARLPLRSNLKPTPTTSAGAGGPAPAANGSRIENPQIIANFLGAFPNRLKKKVIAQVPRGARPFTVWGRQPRRAPPEVCS